MEQVSVESVEIINVSQRAYENWTRNIDISFTIRPQHYSITLTANVLDVFFPYGVYHKTGHSCLFCSVKRAGAYCEGLSNQANVLFHKLIEFPSIRLEWLYLNYVPKQQKG